ncbi:Plasma membrane iron permease [Wickerhamomyces ciferrii]|uniref:Plasma membrane iron permease n=1 Tax=Wickerhamomyces ciferrii (strain ATCC 14091 / BCRC 22168 / CBS 111 / JCM 3599 / NBRC 0793 / NRRL Y-1031 F-60-10) TaxID=1206466 RepID=K0KDU1_WICCF|nr:Plasma membrane iron permease [Wickerhamomyces ciferrii]CCH41096.1 Plasma membrane iron permease [Wickerhamomyces ciferrii]
MLGDLFSLKVFFILLRETFESAIVISILLSFLKQNFTKPVQNEDGEVIDHVLTIDKKVYRHLKVQVWLGGFFGLFICGLIGAVFIALFYLVGENYWSKYERNWEAIFSILSSLFISLMGLSLLRVNQMQKKWEVKLGINMKKQFGNEHQPIVDDEGTILSDEADIIAQQSHGHKQQRRGLKYWFNKMTDKYQLMILPMVTLLREGLEAIFVVSGVSASEPASTLPLSIISALALGSLIGWSIYKGGSKMKLQIFLIFSTCFLYLVSAGLMSRGVWFFELEEYVQRCHGQDMSEVGTGPGSYDVTNVIWHVNCCSGLTDGGWMLLNALFGWTNTATYGSIISYNVYWIFIIVLLKIKLFQERRGYIPFIPIKWQLKKIAKRYEIIKFNLQHNSKYKYPEVELQAAPGTVHSNGYSSVHTDEYNANDQSPTRLNVINDDTSEATSSLIGGQK